jgi:hypothetical protein
MQDESKRRRMPALVLSVLRCVGEVEAAKESQP